MVSLLTALRIELVRAPAGAGSFELQPGSTQFSASFREGLFVRHRMNRFETGALLERGA